MKIIDCDVLVVGAGGAALRAAIAAKEAKHGLKVCLATKGRLGKSGVTAISCSDRMAFHCTLGHTEPGGPDAWRYHADDIYRIGGLVSDRDLAEVLAREAGEAFAYLDGLGVPFAKKDGMADQFVTDGSDYARACYTGPKTANHIEEALVRRFRQLDIDTYEFTAVHRLITAAGRVIGAAAVDTKEKDAAKAAFAFATPAVILATGGGGLIYEHNVFPGGMGGDGFAMAYAAGAELVNMEFIQLGIASTTTKFNCSGSMMRAIPRLVNDKDEEVLAAYFPPGTSPAEIFNILFQKGASWPVSFEHKTHIIDIALYKEWQAGRRVFLDYGRNPAGFNFELLTAANRERYRRELRSDLGAEKRGASPLYRLMEINPASIEWFKERGIDLAAGDRIEVAACAQHFQGGVKIDARARTAVPGLWAAGETAGGQHGANRPGGNALLDCQVFGRIAGEDAAASAQPLNQADLGRVAAGAAGFGDELAAMGAGDIAASGLRRAIQAIMSGSASIIRTADGLRDGLGRLALLKKQRPYIDGQGVDFCLETQGMLITAETVLMAAALRDESRGPHLRFAAFADNAPQGRKDPEWQQYIVIRRGPAGPELTVKKPVS